jgi:hypothetical protein
MRASLSRARCATGSTRAVGMPTLAPDADAGELPEPVRGRAPWTIETGALSIVRQPRSFASLAPMVLLYSLPGQRYMTLPSAARDGNAEAAPSASPSVVTRPYTFLVPMVASPCRSGTPPAAAPRA